MLAAVWWKFKVNQLLSDLAAKFRLSVDTVKWTYQSEDLPSTQLL